MINFLISIFAFSFLPVFILSDVFFEKKGEERVLGQETGIVSLDQSCGPRQQQGAVSYNLFPLERSNSIFTPLRKPDFYDIKIWAGSSVAIDVGSGTILEYHEGRRKTQIASLTKVMTATLVAEKVSDLDEIVVIPQEALLVSGTVVGCPTSTFCNSNQLYAGEKISVRNLLKAMLLNSANDAATALAIHVSGSEESFVSLMNNKAEDLGLKDTNFCTPSGLEKDGYESECYSSAYDIARIAAYSLKHEVIWDIMRTTEEEIYSADGKYMHQLKNTDILLTEMDGCIGGKTGFTPMAGKSLRLAVADPTQKHQVIAVVLNDDNRWEDMKKLVNWIFENYEWR